MAKILGIDLGTTFSAGAIVKEGEPQIIESTEGTRVTPSVVAISKSGERLIGVLARRQQITNPENTVFSVKRLIGRRFDDPIVQKDIKNLPYKLRKRGDGGIEIKMGDRWYKPPEISAMVLQKIKKDVEERLGEKIEEAVITCPAYFNDSQRKATKVAGEIAGFKVKRVFNEPTAAALAYGLTKKGRRKIIVYDFGGGTFDISVLEVDEDTVEVIATGGDTHLGGEDFDQRIMEWVIDQFKKEQGIDLSKDPLALQRVKEAAEKAKIELSTALETEINLPFITSDAAGPKHLLYKLNRAKLEDLVQDYISKSIKLVEQTLKEAKFDKKDIDDILLVGGQTRMPKIQEEIKKLFGKEPNREINPDEVVAIGAAVQAGIFGGEVEDVLLLDVTPLSLGIETLGGVNTVLIPKNTTVPTSKSQVFSTAADNQTSVGIHVLQGERAMAKDNKSLGRFMLDGIPPSPRGIPQIEVTFDIDANGILNVSAKDRATNRSQSIRIEGSSGISKEEKERMKKEAEMHAEEDKKKRDIVIAKNQADTLIHASEKTLRESGDKISEDIRKEIEEGIEILKTAKGSDNIEEIQAKTSNLSRALQKVGAQMYQSDSDQGGQKEEKKRPETEEGEYKEKL